MLNDKEIALLNDTYAVQFQKLGHLLQAKKEIEADEKAIKEELEEAFIKYGIKKFENEHVIMTYIAPSESKSINLKAFQDAEPVTYAELLEDYPKVTKKKGYIRFERPKK